MQQTMRQLNGMGHLFKPDPRKVKTPDEMLDYLDMVGRAVKVLRDNLAERELIAAEDAPEPEKAVEPEPEREETGGRDRMSRKGRKRAEADEPTTAGIAGTD